MNGYSKINNVTGSGDSSHKSRSIDFSDMFSSFPQTPKQSKNKNSSSDDDESGRGEQFGVILGRSTSVSSSSSSSAPAGMKRTFSVRRSSSVSDQRYCRIHDHYNMAIINGDETTDIVDQKKKHRGGKILRACKRFLRF